MTGTTTNRWTKRTFLGVPLIGWALFVVAGTAIAAVVFYLNLGVTGTISMGQGLDEADFAYESISAVEGDCGATIDVDGNLAITGLDAGLYPGDYCEIRVVVENTGTVDAEYNGFNTHYDPGTDNVPMFSAAWDLNGDGHNEVDWCGDDILAGQLVIFGFRLDVHDNMTSGATYSLGINDGPVFVPLGTANCG